MLVLRLAALLLLLAGEPVAQPCDFPALPPLLVAGNSLNGRMGVIEDLPAAGDWFQPGDSSQAAISCRYPHCATAATALLQRQHGRHRKCPRQ